MNAVMFVHFLSLCVHIMVNSAKTNSQLVSFSNVISFSNALASARTPRTAWESPCPQRCTNPFMEAPTCFMCMWRAERGCVWVYPPGPRAAVENHRDIYVNFLFLACFISFFFYFFLAVLILSPDLLHVLTWPWKGGFSNYFASKRKRSWQAFIFHFSSYVG